ncbi:MAG: hypothetical protein LBQ20_03740 [Rhodanobacter sp.]|jgi:hypothetical protein|nr:hypothetical protein [Rhodanobacter sp.]
MRPSPDAGAFLLPASMGTTPSDLWRAVRGSRKARRSSGRYVNRVPSVTSFDIEAAVTQLPEDRTMNRSIPAARAAMPENLSLPLKLPRQMWAAILEHAARALEGRRLFDSETLDRQLRAVALERLAVELRAIAEDLCANRYAELYDALRDYIEAEQPVAQMHTAENACEVLHRVGGAA